MEVSEAPINAKIIAVETARSRTNFGILPWHDHQAHRMPTIKAMQTVSIPNQRDILLWLSVAGESEGVTVGSCCGVSVILFIFSEWVIIRILVRVFARFTGVDDGV